jgi:hypothetical protein
MESETFHLKDNTAFLAKFLSPKGRSGVHPWLGCAIFLCASAVYIARRFSLSIELLQSCFFPLLMLLFWRLPRSASFRLPAPLVGFGLLGWAVATLNIHGYLPALRSGPVVFLSKLDNDTDEREARAFVLRYISIARAYELPRIEIVLRKFQDGEQGTQWLRSHGAGSLLLSGSAEWLSVNFPDNAMSLPSTGGRVKPEYDQLLRREAERWKVNLQARNRIIVIPGLDVPVVVAVVPQSLNVSGNPTELARHYIGWLARAVGPDSGLYREFGDNQQGVGGIDSFERLQRFAFRADAVSQTTMMLGAWRSPEPISAARFLFATVSLVEALQEGSAQSQAIDAALSLYGGAQKLLRKSEEPELLSLIRNNMSAARLLQDNSEDDLSKIRREFITAAEITDNNGIPTRGARLAMLNLEMLEYAGVL